MPMPMPMLRNEVAETWVVRGACLPASPSTSLSPEHHRLTIDGVSDAHLSLHQIMIYPTPSYPCHSSPEPTIHHGRREV